MLVETLVGADGLLQGLLLQKGRDYNWDRVEVLFQENIVNWVFLELG
jgi:hypothetical protein